MSFFRRPRNSSDYSSSSSESSEEKSKNLVGPSSKTDTADEELDRSLATTTEEVSEERSPFLDSQDSSEHQNTENVRDMMLASLLEDYSLTRAAEVLNASNPGRNYTRHSPEAQALAQRGFAQISQTLSQNNLLPLSVTSEGLRNARLDYLSGLDSLALGQQAPASVLKPLARVSDAPHPADDRQLTVRSPRTRSHYQTSFRQEGLIGKGGFGKVFKCYNHLDNKTYAVKKIPLPSQFSKNLFEGNLDDLKHILREVQALATLDHVNVVRYHHTWVEEPQNLAIRAQCRRQLLIENHPFSHGDDSAGVVFEDDTLSHHENRGEEFDRNLLQWSEQPQDRSTVETLSTDDSNIFTDGDDALHEICPNLPDSNGNTYTLHIQMSLYPTTLAHYIAPSNKSTLRHCYHLIPSLRILSAILAGLQYIHSKGFVHRDIKPVNIFLSSPEVQAHSGYCDVGSCRSCQGRTEQWLNPRIGDFGLVTRLALLENPLQEPVGTTYYNPPPWPKPTGSGGKSGNEEKIDIFALGVVFIEMMCMCETAMERVDILKGLQKGCIPGTLATGLKKEGWGMDIIAEVMGLAKGMLEPNPAARWSSRHIHRTVEDILTRL